MSTTITIKLNAPASQFQAGESTGFGIRGGVRYYDRETKKNEYTNYEAVIFAKQAGQIQFYQQALVEGSVVEVMGKQEKIKTFDGQNGQKLSIELLDASLGMIHTVDQPQQQAPQQPGYAPQQQQAQGGYQQQNAPHQQQYQQAPQQQQGGFQNQNGGYAPK
jgi:single-strand DNA-binding protein